MPDPVVYQGSLGPKSKKDLQEIADSLGVPSDGRKEQIVERIKIHLAQHEDTLKDDPKYSGLIRRKPSSKRGSSRSTPVDPDPEPVTPLLKTPGLEPIFESTFESTPVIQRERDARDVSFALKNPTTPFTPNTTISKSFTVIASSPEQGPIVSFASPDLDLSQPEDEDEGEKLEEAEEESSPSEIAVSASPSVVQPPRTLEKAKAVTVEHAFELEDVRRFLSNSRNAWSVNSVGEALYILAVIVPWQYFTIPGTSLALPYAPLSTIQSAHFWLTFFHWIVPTMIIPAAIGNVITFVPSLKTTAAPFDPLTAAMVRLAASVLYRHPSYTLSEGQRVTTDVLGSEWRTVSAAIGVGFAFAEVAGLMFNAVTKS